MHEKIPILTTLSLGGLCLIFGGVACAQSIQLTTLVNFDNTNGAYPQAGLTLATDGSLYGATYGGGTNRVGTVFKVTTSGIFTSLFSFSNANGSVPYGRLALGAEGSFYGTTATGTTNGYGTVFKFTTNGVMTPLVSFDSTNGAYPEAGLVPGSDGLFYGTTYNGGTNGYGTVFKVTTNGILTVLENFNSLNGAFPFAGLTLGNDGLFYGITFLGGLYNQGSIFKVTTNGTFASIFSFDLAVSNGSGAKTNTTGAFSFGGLAEGNDGNFYGTASSGGKYGYGTAFKVTTNGVLTKLVDFNNINGASPEASLLLASDGSFYGTTYNGGLNGAGTVYNLTTNGIITTLYAFSPAVWSGSAYTNAHGGAPESVLTFGADGNLYGTTMYGGTGGSGTVFKLTLLPGLKIQWLAGNVVLSWANPAFSLESAPEAAGSYNTIVGAVSPYTNAISGNRKFFRLVGK